MITADIDTRIPSVYWNHMVQLKLDLCFMENHFSSCIRVIKTLRIIRAAGTAATAATWMTWPDDAFIRFICPIIIILLQILDAVSEALPHYKRKQELREAVSLLQPIYDQMEKDWSKIQNGEYSLDEIREKTYLYIKKRRSIERLFFKDDDLPEKKKIREKSIADTDNYLKRLMGEESNNGRC